VKLVVNVMLAFFFRMDFLKQELLTQKASMKKLEFSIIRMLFDDKMYTFKPLKD